MSNNAKRLAAVTGTIVLVGSGALIAPLAFADTDPTQTPLVSNQEAFSSNASESIIAKKVEGTFLFNQCTISSNESISNVFMKAATAMCASLPDYLAYGKQIAIAVGGDVKSPFLATVDEMAEKEGVASYIMACACSSNAVGGGAIANAEVSGVTVESLAFAAGAK